MSESESERKRECPVCDGSGYESVHDGVVECHNCDGTGIIKIGPEWDEAPVTLSLIESIIEGHPDYTLTSHHGPDGRRYVMLQFFEDEPNQEANSEFVSFVSGLDEDLATDGGDA